VVDEEYAIVSKAEFEKLRKELDRLKKNPMGDSEKGQNLQDSIENLSRSLNTMMSIFKEAAEDMQLEGRDQQMIGKKIDPMLEKLDTLIEQNQKIAKGLIAVADMVKDKLEKIEEHAQRSTSSNQQRENQNNSLPPLGSSMGFDSNSFPPLPPQGQMMPPGLPPLPGFDDMKKKPMGMMR